MDRPPWDNSLHRWEFYCVGTEGRRKCSKESLMGYSLNLSVYQITDDVERLHPGILTSEGPAWGPTCDTHFAGRAQPPRGASVQQAQGRGTSWLAVERVEGGKTG